MAARLTKEALEAVRGNAELFISISKVLHIKPTSLAMSLSNNSRRLIEHPVLKLISKHTGMEIEDLIEDFSDIGEDEGENKRA